MKRWISNGSEPRPFDKGPHADPDIEEQADYWGRR